MGGQACGPSRPSLALSLFPFPATPGDNQVLPDPKAGLLGTYKCFAALESPLTQGVVVSLPRWMVWAALQL